MYGLVLEGGGARGAYQIGAWKALRELGIEINGVSGTSVGALNGAMIIQNKFDEAYELWNNISPSTIMNIDDALLERIIKKDVTEKDIRLLVDQFKVFVGNKGIDITPLKQLIDEKLDEDIIRKSNKDFGIVTISLTDMKPIELFIEDIPQGQLIKYLIASASLPVFKQEKLAGKLYLDGGFYNNLPINLLVSKGYKDIIAIRLKSIGITQRVKDDGLNITYIEPSEDLGRILDFSPTKARKNIKLGYFDTLKVFYKLKGMKYYVESKKDEEYFIDYFMNLDKNTVKRIGKILGIEDMPYRRMLFEFIIPKIAELLDVDKDGSYEDILIAFYEEAAQRYDIDRFKIYKFDDFKDNIFNQYSPSKENLSTMIPRIFKQSDWVLKSVKKEILDELIDELLGNIA